MFLEICDIFKHLFQIIEMGSIACFIWAVYCLLGRLWMHETCALLSIGSGFSGVLFQEALPGAPFASGSGFLPRGGAPGPPAKIFGPGWGG